MNKDKPFKGYIRDWAWERYPNGIVASGIPIGHPNFTGWIRTSKVVNKTPCDNGDTAIETLNSRYILLGPEVK